MTSQMLSPGNVTPLQSVSIIKASSTFSSLNRHADLPERVKRTLSLPFLPRNCHTKSRGDSSTRLSYVICSPSMI